MSSPVQVQNALRRLKAAFGGSGDSIPASSKPADYSLFMFMAFATITGSVMGMVKILTPLFAMRLGATTAQIGIISSFDNITGALTTLPAGLMIARYGGSRIYLIGSIGATLAFFLAPWSHTWLGLAIVVSLVSAVAPFRVVALGGAYLQRLPVYGPQKAGWYRGAMTVGTLLAGPFLGTLMLRESGPFGAYLLISGFYAVMTVASPYIFTHDTQNHGQVMTLWENISGLWNQLKEKTTFAVCMIEFSSGLTRGGFMAFIVVFAVRGLHLGEYAAASLQFFQGIVAVATMFAGGILVQGIRQIYLYRVSLIFMVGGTVAIAAANSFSALIAATLIVGLAQGLVHIINTQRLAATKADKGRVSSLQILSSTIGASIGAAVASAVVSFVGLRGVFYLSAALYAVLSIRWCWHDSEEPPRITVPTAFESKE